MLAYVVRRSWQFVPTLLGVVLLVRVVALVLVFYMGGDGGVIVRLSRGVLERDVWAVLEGAVVAVVIEGCAIGG